MSTGKGLVKIIFPSKLKGSNPVLRVVDSPHEGDRPGQAMVGCADGTVARAPGPPVGGDWPTYALPPHQPDNRTAGARTLRLAAESERLMLHLGDEPSALEPGGPDFYVDHPDFELYLLCFGRRKGEVVEAFHGPDWYTNDRYPGPTTFDHPQAWDAYPGHYRSHNPELAGFRIVLRKGVPVLIQASGDEEPMVSLGGTRFRVGEDARSPERISFDTIVDGRALRAILSCGNYYRTA